MCGCAFERGILLLCTAIPFPPFHFFTGEKKQPGGREIGTEALTKDILPRLKELQNDRVPNVRYVLVKTFQKLLSHLEENTIQQEIKPILEKLSNDEDEHVKAYSKKVMEKIG